MKLCKGCNRKLPLDQFFRRAASKDGHSFKCKRCESKRANVGDAVESDHNKKVYRATFQMFRERFGNG